MVYLEKSVQIRDWIYWWISLPPIHVATGRSLSRHFDTISKDILSLPLLRVYRGHRCQCRLVTRLKARQRRHVGACMSDWAAFSTTLCKVAGQVGWLGPPNKDPFSNRRFPIPKFVMWWNRKKKGTEKKPFKLSIYRMQIGRMKIGRFIRCGRTVKSVALLLALPI